MIELSRFQQLRRSVVKGLAFAAPGLATGAVVGDMIQEHQQIDRERKKLDGPASLLLQNQQLESLKADFTEQFRMPGRDVPPWTLLQSLALLNNVKFARNQFFVTREEAEDSIRIINRSGQFALERHNKPEMNELIFRESNSQMYTSMAAIAANVALTSAYYIESSKPDPKYAKKIERRKFLKYGLAAGSIVTAPLAISGSIFQPTFERTDSLHEGIPIHALKALRQENEKQLLDEYINALTVPPFEDLIAIPQYAHTAITADILTHYEEEYGNPDLPSDEREILSQRIEHARSSDYQSYIARLQSISSFTANVLPVMLSAPQNSPLLTQKELSGIDDRVFDIGIGFILDDRLQRIQTVHHDIQNVDQNLYPIIPETPTPTIPSNPT